MKFGFGILIKWIKNSPKKSNSYDSSDQLSWVDDISTSQLVKLIEVEQIVIGLLAPILAWNGSVGERFNCLWHLFKIEWTSKRIGRGSRAEGSRTLGVQVGERISKILLEEVETDLGEAT